MALGQRLGGTARRLGLMGGLGSLLIGVILGIVAQAWPAALQAAAQARSSVLTVVLSDGRLLALEGNSWSELPRSVGNGVTVTGIAWHPTRPEVLLAQRTFSRREPIEASHALVYVDLATGREKTIIEGVGPQATIAGPQIAPDGKSGFARIECCMSSQIISFDLPLTGEKPQQGPAGGFLTQEAREVSFVTAGAYAPDGRILMTVWCCISDDATVDPRGLYRVSADLKTATKLATGIDGLPIGLGPGGAWAAVLEAVPASEDAPRDYQRLVILDLPSGQRRPPLSESEMWLADAGAVAPDGTIIVAGIHAPDMPYPPYGSLFRVTVNGAVAPVPDPDRGGVTAFGLASAESVAAARKGTAVAPQPGASDPQAVSAKTPSADFPHEVKVYFSKRPESDADFTAVFPVPRHVGDAGVAHAALEELLHGPTPEEQAAGYFSQIGGMLVGPSNCGGEPFTLRLDAGTATLTFCQLVRSAGIGQDARAQAALEATLLQFSTIQRVRILTPEGDCLFEMSGENRCLNEP